MAMNEPKYTVNGKAYFGPTYNICPVCDRDIKSYMMIKLTLAGGDICLECPRCDYDATVSASQVIYNANRAKVLGSTGEEVTFNEE